MWRWQAFVSSNYLFYSSLVMHFFWIRTQVPSLRSRSNRANGTKVLRGLLATKWKIKLVKLGHTALVASTSQFALGLPQLVFFLASPCIRMSEKPKTSERIDEQYFSKIVEDFSSRAMKLESDLFRLNKTASIVDIRVEYQEIEKFSVINRFAKFHCRGQSDAAETSSSGGTTPTALKSCPQRYVTAFPMPRTVPEGAPCLSL